MAPEVLQGKEPSPLSDIFALGVTAYELFTRRRPFERSTERELIEALLHEIQFAEQEIRINEDRILEVMVNAEARDKDVKAAEAELKAETAEIEKEKEGEESCRRNFRPSSSQCLPKSETYLCSSH